MKGGSATQMIKKAFWEVNKLHPLTVEEAVQSAEAYYNFIGRPHDNLIDKQCMRYVFDDPECRKRTNFDRALSFREWVNWLMKKHHLVPAGKAEAIPPMRIAKGKLKILYSENVLPPVNGGGVVVPEPKPPRNYRKVSASMQAPPVQSVLAFGDSPPTREEIEAVLRRLDRLEKFELEVRRSIKLG